MSDESMGIFEKLSHEYYNLTAAEKKVADYILAHQQQTQFLSISQLAEAGNVAEATVSRFCRRLGYSGYNAFKLAVANSAAQQGPWSNPLSGQVRDEDSLEDVCGKLYSANVEAMTQTMAIIRPDDIRRAADLLERAERVLCMGQGGSMIIAEEAAHLFSTVSGKFLSVTDGHSQAVAVTMLKPGDVVLYFSYSGSTVDMMQTMKLARRYGARIILFTRFPKSPGAELSHMVLPYSSTESPLQMGSIPVRIAQLYLLDVLFSELCRRDLETCRRRRAQVADALAERHL